MSSSDTIPIASIDISMVDDPLRGVAIVVYAAGCPRRCPGCHNPKLQDPAEGVKMKYGALVDRIRSIKQTGLVNSIVFLGGDWIPWYADWCRRVCEEARRLDLRTVLYTGELYENLSGELRAVLDWVIDGPYDATKVSVFPASSNQRVFRNGELVVPETLPLYRHLSVGAVG